MRWVRFNDGRRNAYPNSRRTGAENGRGDCALSKRAPSQRGAAAVAFVAGTLRVHQRRSHLLDRRKTRTPTDQHSRGGHFLSNVPPAPRWENEYPGLSYAELRNGGWVGSNGKFARASGNRAPERWRTSA